MALMFVLVVSAVTSVGAQTSTTGDIAGVVTDPTAAVVSGVSNFGTQRRNQFRGPGYFDTDFDVEKSFAIPRWESAQFSVGARFFNLFNHPNFAFPNTNV